MFTMKREMVAAEVQWIVLPAGPVGLPPGDHRMQDHLVTQVLDSTEQSPR